MALFTSIGAALGVTIAGSAFWGGMAVVGTTAATVAATTASVISTAQGVQQQQYNEDLANAQAEQETLNASAAQKRADQEAIARTNDAKEQAGLERERNLRIKAQMRASAGMQGMEQSSGSDLLFKIHQAQNMELNALELRRQGQMESDQIRYQGLLNRFDHTTQASQYKSQATMFKMQAGSELTSGLGNTASTLASGASSFSSTLKAKS